MARFRIKLYWLMALFILSACSKDGQLDLESSSGTSTSSHKLSLSLDVGQSVNIDMRSGPDGSGALTLTTRFAYNTDSFPGLLNSCIRSIAKDETNSLIYVGDFYTGVTVIDTQNTDDVTDDVILRTYTGTSTPALGSSSGVTYISFDSTTGYLFVGAYSGGLTVIDTKNNKDPNDDVLVKTYKTTSTPAIANNHVYGFYKSSSGLYYVGTLGGLTVIDTHNTVSPADDTLVGTYKTSTTPAISHNQVYSVWEDASNDLIYISTRSGLNVINHHGTTSLADDTPVATYKSTSTPATSSDWAFNSWLDPITGLLYISNYWTGGGVTVIDTHGTSSAADDSLFVNYSPLISAFGPGSTRHTLKHGDLIYASTFQGVAVIDTKGTLSAGDDSVSMWRGGKELPGNNVYETFVDAAEKIHVSTDMGLLVIGDHYNTSGSYDLFPISLTNQDYTSVSWSATVSSGQTVTIQTRTANIDYAEDFDDGITSNISDLNAWGSIFPNIVEVDGALQLSGVPSDSTYAAFSIDTGEAPDFFPAGTQIYFKYRATTSSPISDCVYVDGWEHNGMCFYPTNGEWEEYTYTAESAFSSLGFEPYWESGAWTASDKIEIKDVKFITPTSWTAWSSAYSKKNGSDLASDLNKDLIQVRINLSTTDTTKTPKVKSIHFD